jgi:hypothetical protein
MLGVVELPLLLLPLEVKLFISSAASSCCLLLLTSTCSNWQ